MTGVEGITWSSPLLVDSIVYHCHTVFQLPLASQRGGMSQQGGLWYFYGGSICVSVCSCWSWGVFPLPAPEHLPGTKVPELPLLSVFTEKKKKKNTAKYFCYFFIAKVLTVQH